MDVISGTRHIESAELKGIIEKIREVERVLKALIESLESNP